MMSSGLAKQDNRFVTLFLFTQAFDILLNCQLIRVISNSTRILSGFEADTWIQHITYCHSFQYPLKN